MEILEQEIAQASLALTLLALVALAVRQDLKERRIANQLTITGFVAAVFLQTLSGGSPGFFFALAGAGVGLACFLPLYLCKGMGAGDVKLMAAAGAFFGPLGAFAAAMISLVAGAVLAVAFLMWRSRDLRTPATAGGLQVVGGTTPAQLRKERFPYAVAIAAGVFVTMWSRRMLEVFIP